MKKRASESSKFILKMSNGLIRLFFDVLLYVFVSIVIVQSCRYAFDFCYQVFGPVAVAEEDEEGEEVEFYIASGDSTREIAKKMERSGLIKNDLAFYIKAKLNDANIQPGTYLLNTSMTYSELLETISSLPAAGTEETSQ